MKYSREQIEQEESLTKYIDDLVQSEKSRILYAIDNYDTNAEQAKFLNYNIRTYFRRLSEYGLLKNERQ